MFMLSLCLLLCGDPKPLTPTDVQRLMDILQEQTEAEELQTWCVYNECRTV